MAIPVSEIKANAETPPAPGRRRTRRVALFVLCVLITVSSFAVAIFLLTRRPIPLTPLPTGDALTYQSILEWTLENGMPGGILLVKSPRVDYIGSVGWADIERKIPMRPDHAFRIGSITKMFLGIVAAQLHTEGILDTALPITHYLPPDITRHIPNSDRITVRQLVRHTSGIFNYTENLRFQLDAFLFDHHGSWTPMRMLQYAYDKPAYFAPEEGFHYSNTNFLLLGLIVDQVTGHHHSIEIRNRILEPLGLAGTYYERVEPPRGERAHGYESIPGLTVDTYDWTMETGGDGGMVSTVADLAVFVKAVTGKDSFLNAETRQLLKSQPATSPVDQPWYPVLHYDFGVTAERGAAKDIPVSEAPWFFGHGGATVGYVCSAFHEPNEDITIAYFGASTLVRHIDMGFVERFLSQLRQSLFKLAVEQTRAAAQTPNSQK